MAFYVLAGIAIAGAVLSAVLVESGPSTPETEREPELVPAFDEAA